MTGALILQILAAVGGLAGFSAIINLLISRKKIAAESDDIVQNTTDRVIKNLTDDNTTLRKENKESRTEISDLRVQNGQLYDIISGMEQKEMEYRSLIIRLINWTRNAWEKIVEGRLEGVEQPPSLEHITKVIRNEDSK